MAHLGPPPPNHAACTCPTTRTVRHLPTQLVHWPVGCEGLPAECFRDSWNHYLSPLFVPIPGPSGATPLQAAPERTDVEFGKQLPEPDVAVSDETFRSQFGRFCSAVAVER